MFSIPQSPSPLKWQPNLPIPYAIINAGETASKIKSGNPYCLFFIVCETYEVGKQVDPQYTDIDQIYSLRKSDKRGSRDPIQAEIVLDLFNRVKNHLDSNWSNVSENIKSGKIIQWK